MKKIIFAFCMTLGTAAFVNAQDTTSTQSPTDPTSTTPTQTEQPASETPSTAAVQEDGRVKIKSQELPDAVKKSLESQEYRGWLVNSAYKVDGTSTSDPNASVSATSSAYGKELFIVELKNGAQTKTVRFDKDGKKLDDEGMENDQK